MYVHEKTKERTELWLNITLNLKSRYQVDLKSLLSTFFPYLFLCISTDETLKYIHRPKLYSSWSTASLIHYLLNNKTWFLFLDVLMINIVFYDKCFLVLLQEPAMPGPPFDISECFMNLTFVWMTQSREHQQKRDLHK